MASVAARPGPPTLSRLVPLLSVVLLVACSKAPSEEALDRRLPSPPPVTASTTAATPSTPGTEPSKPGVAAFTRPLPAFPEKAIKQGRLSGQMFPAFTIRRHGDDANASWLPAMNACTKKGLALCTESQWLRACGLDPSLGEFATWTATPSGNGFVVRGGDSGCHARAVLKGGEASPNLAGLCCDRVVAMDAPPAGAVQHISAANSLLRYEQAMNKHSTKDLESVLGEAVIAFNKKGARKDALGAFAESFKEAPDQWILLDRCAPEQRQEEDLWWADCSTVTHKNGAIGLVTLRLTFLASKGTLGTIEEIRVSRKPSPI